MISNFLLQRVMPVVFAVLGISCIDTPQNFVRRILLEIVDIITLYFSAIFHALG